MSAGYLIVSLLFGRFRTRNVMEHVEIMKPRRRKSKNTLRWGVHLIRWHLSRMCAVKVVHDSFLNAIVKPSDIR